MTKLSWVVVLSTTFVGSLTGGILGERLFIAGVVHAQKANGVHAEEYLLLDQTGKARAGLYGKHPPGRRARCVRESSVGLDDEPGSDPAAQQRGSVRGSLAVAELVA